MATVGFTAMADGTREDYALLARRARRDNQALPERVLAALAELAGFGQGYQIDRLQHSLQTATRAHRDGAEEEMVVAALLHDLGDALAPANHAAYAAAILEPYVTAETCWTVRHHGIFQLYYYGRQVGRDAHARERYRDHPGYARTVAFCERWDQTSFDPDYDTFPVDFFEPMVRRVFARTPRIPVTE